MTRGRTHFIGCLSLAALLSLAIPAASHAALILPELPPSINLTVSAGGNTYTLQSTVTNNGDGTYTFVGSATGGPRPFDMSWNVTIDPDPMVDAFYSIRNTTSTTQTYTVNSFIPITPAFAGPSFDGGSIGVTLTDADGSGSATLGSTQGQAVYTAFVDGVPVHSLFNSNPSSAYSFTVSGSGDTGTQSANFGLPFGTHQESFGANATIGIQLKFTLSPGDSAGLTSFYQIEPVPEPAGMTLLGLSAAAMLVRRRSR